MQSIFINNKTVRSATDDKVKDLNKFTHHIVSMDKLRITLQEINAQQISSPARK